ncbi:MAG: DUF3122 domain-containing protein [Symploca sp. SIO1C4]|uniref:DUF3122 domain-containing protein n=1 Tax=Symploca sp. SIO1C4 TaxID=2607765 RepID=A0A6B3N6E6_9CYAN|nr:DUF3122 domain-containing protein [Symploca sp. SIO1C4]NET08481.1 DUF3122 domain-containing protein [Symploca sp. SIO2B6]NET53894.1 DUF3122 domain-containing protein [Merismopedia sp. SIO2A8]
MWFGIQQSLSRLVLLTSLVLIFLLGLGSWSIPPATASIRQMEEAPGQILVQSRHTLRDETGNSWQVVLFKRIKANDATSINLRLVGFPGAAKFAHPQPLTIITETGTILNSKDMFAEKSPAANVGQYDFKNALNKLPTAASVRLFPVMSDPQPIELKIPPEVILEWQIVAASN